MGAGCQWYGLFVAVLGTSSRALHTRVAAGLCFKAAWTGVLLAPGGGGGPGLRRRKSAVLSAAGGFMQWSVCLNGDGAGVYGFCRMLLHGMTPLLSAMGVGRCHCFGWGGPAATSLQGA
jgi:hypothetical protein